MPQLADDGFQDLCACMRSTVGLHFSAYKRALVLGRLGLRIRQLGMGGFATTST